MLSYSDIVNSDKPFKSHCTKTSSPWSIQAFSFERPVERTNNSEYIACVICPKSWTKWGSSQNELLLWSKLLLTIHYLYNETLFLLSYIHSDLDKDSRCKIGLENGMETHLLAMSQSAIIIYLGLLMSVSKSTHLDEWKTILNESKVENKRR